MASKDLDRRYARGEDAKVIPADLLLTKRNRTPLTKVSLVKPSKKIRRRKT